MTDPTTSPTLHTRLRQIADDPTWSVVLRMEARTAPFDLADGPTLPDDDLWVLLTERIRERAATRPTGKALTATKFRQWAFNQLGIAEEEWPQRLEEAKRRLAATRGPIEEDAT